MKRFTLLFSLGIAAVAPSFAHSTLGIANNTENAVHTVRASQELISHKQADTWLHECGDAGKIWAIGLGNFTNSPTKNGEQGFSSSAGGMLAGYDARITDDFRLGLAAGFTAGRLTNKELDGHTNQYTTTVGVYGTNALSKQIYLDWFSLAGETRNGIHIKDHGHPMKGNYSIYTSTTGAKLSWRIDCKEFVIAPYTGLYYTFGRQHGFNTNHGSEPMRAISQDMQTWEIPVGVTISRHIHIGNRHVNFDFCAAYIPAISRNHATESYKGIKEHAACESPHKFAFDTGACLQISKHWELSITYGIELAPKYLTQHVALGASYTF